ncbi:MAG: preprotein translocase subunit SecG [Alphaproteobacteria bacterium]|nr:preprotein translocase subunit SecG [Alphaproteobacteria bacterium]
MSVFILSLHIFLCTLLILVILLQPGKGGDVASAFGGGGGSSTVFGPRGPASLLNQATTIVAVLFMVTSILLAVRSTKDTQGTGDDLESDFERFQQEEAEAGQGFGELPAPVNMAPPEVSPEPTPVETPEAAPEEAPVETPEAPAEDNASESPENSP